MNITGTEFVGIVQLPSQLSSVSLSHQGNIIIKTKRYHVNKIDIDLASKQHKYIQAQFNMWIFHIKATVVDIRSLPIINYSVYHDISTITRVSWKIS